MDFDDTEWKQISNNPIILQTQKDNVSLDREDVSNKSDKLIFKNGAEFQMVRVTGKFRLTWNDDDIV